MLNQNPGFNRKNGTDHSKDYVAMSAKTLLRKVTLTLSNTGPECQSKGNG